MDDLIVTSVNPTYIAQCIQFDNAQGQSQLICILEGKTSSFRVSCDTSDNPRIRFIDSAFKEQLEGIRHQVGTSQLPNLCALLVNQIQTGRVLIETKHRDGKVVAITSASLIDHEKISKYRKKHVEVDVQVAGNKFFKEIAEAFDESLQVILDQVVAFNKKQNEPETHLEVATKQLDRKIIAQKEVKKSLFGRFSGYIESLCDFFKPSVSKVLDKMIADAREHARLSNEQQIQDRRKERRRKSEERQKEAIKQDIALSERKLEIRKTEQLEVN